MSGADRNNNRSRSRDHRERGGQKNARDASEKRIEKRERSPIDRRANNGKFEQSGHHHGHGGESLDDIVDPNSKKKIASKCRLFVGNLSNEVKEADLKELFTKYGEITECFLSSKGYGFVRLATRACAEMAKENIDGIQFKGRHLRVRYAVHGASLKISELNPFVSNELLYQAFSMFGEVERAVHILDEKSQPTGEGVVEFERKPGAVDALRRINDGVFLLSSNPRPVFVEPLDPKDDEDGLMERMIPKTGIYQKERLFPPRFALPGSFEFEFGNRWKELYRLERLRREQLERELKEAREKLESEMELAFQEYQAVQLREDLRRRQEELDHLEAARRERMEVFKMREEERMRTRQQNMSMPPPMAQPPLFPGGFNNPPPFMQPFGANFEGPGGNDVQQRGGNNEGQRSQGPPSEEQLAKVQQLMHMMSQQVQARQRLPVDVMQQQMDGSPRMPAGHQLHGGQFRDERDNRRPAWQGGSEQQQQQKQNHDRGYRYRS